jgi:hypothetical protein
MNLSKLSYKNNLSKTARVVIKNPYTEEVLLDDKGVEIAFNVWNAKSVESANRVVEFKRENEGNPTTFEFMALLIDSIEGVIEYGEDNKKVTSKSSIEEIAEMLEDVDFISEQIMEVSAGLEAFAPKN